MERNLVPVLRFVNNSVQQMKVLYTFMPKNP
jgi:hypothetical protein